MLHEDEDRIDGLKALLSRIPPPDPDPTPGARVWTAPADAAHSAALRASLRSLGLSERRPPGHRHRHARWPPPPPSAARPSSCRWWPATG